MSNSFSVYPFLNFPSSCVKFSVWMSKVTWHEVAWRFEGQKSFASLLSPKIKDIFFNLTKYFFIKIKASSNNVKMSCPSLADSRVSDGAWGYYVNSKIKIHQSRRRKAKKTAIAPTLHMWAPSSVFLCSFFSLSVFFSLMSLNIEGNLRLAYFTCIVNNDNFGLVLRS